MRRSFWIILGISTFLTGLVALGIPPWHREVGKNWPYVVPPLRPFLPFLVLTLIYVVLLIAVERRLAREQSERRFTRAGVTLLGFALAAVLLQLAAIHLVNPSPFSELYRRTVSPGSGGYFKAAVSIEDWEVLLKQFPALMPGWEAHPQRHPPGLVLLFMGWRLLLERFPGVTSVLANPLRLDQCNSSYLMFFDDAQLASAWIGMILPVLSSGFLVWPVYQLGRAFYGPRVSWWAAAWIPLLPSSVIFSPKPNQIYPVLCTMALSAFWYGLKKGKHIWFLVSGGLMSLSTFLSFTNFIYFAALGTLFGVTYYRHYQEERKTSAREMIGRLLTFGLGVSSIWLGYWLYSGVTPIDIWRVASQYHFGIGLPYWPWIWINIQDFVYFGGLVLSGLSLVGFAKAIRRLVSRRPIPDEYTLAVTLWVSLILLDLSGASEGEVSRVWSCYLPLLALTAAAALEQINIPKIGFMLVTIALALNLTVMVGFVRVLGPELSSPPSVSPIEPVSNSRPIGANFEDLAYLEGYRLNETVVEDQIAVEVTLNWQALARFNRVYHVFVHLIAPDGSRVAQSDDIPARQGYPTTCWRPGQRVGDPHLMALPADLPAGSYKMQVGLFLLDTGERLKVHQDGMPEQDFVQVDDVFVIR